MIRLKGQESCGFGVFVVDETVSQLMRVFPWLSGGYISLVAWRARDACWNGTAPKTPASLLACVTGSPLMIQNMQPAAFAALCRSHAQLRLRGRIELGGTDASFQGGRHRSTGCGRVGRLHITAGT